MGWDWGWGWGRQPYAGLPDFFRRGWQVLRHPSVGTFDKQQAAVLWPPVWIGLALLGVIEALEVAYVVYGPDAAAGYSSLPIGPKLLLPQTPLLPLAALLGSIAQFVGFSALLCLCARLLGGHGSYRTQTYLFALFWVPLMALSDVVELIPAVGGWLGPLVRLYALYLCVLALASAHRLPLGRALAALLLPATLGLLVGTLVIFVIRPQLPAGLLIR